MSESALGERLVKMVNSISSPEWKRLRIAVTWEELEEIKAWINANPFAFAIRGVHLEIESDPFNRPYELSYKRVES